MAKIVEEKITIKLSKLVKDAESETSQLLNDDSRAALEQVAQELAGDSVIVEIE